MGAWIKQTGCAAAEFPRSAIHRWRDSDRCRAFLADDGSRVTTMRVTFGDHRLTLELPDGLDYGFREKRRDDGLHFRQRRFKIASG